mmetsp:Transcript_9081/g.38466  ORF Transcript_9081/g.38466 Transcript_9081/m.38466 type:complete len:541 (+) Transcript_9081:639-2261(+)
MSSSRHLRDRRGVSAVDRFVSLHARHLRAPVPAVVVHAVHPAPLAEVVEQRLELALLVHVAVPLKHPRGSVLGRDFLVFSLADFCVLVSVSVAILRILREGFLFFFLPDRLCSLVKRHEHVLGLEPVTGHTPGLLLERPGVEQRDSPHAQQPHGLRDERPASVRRARVMQHRDVQRGVETRRAHRQRRRVGGERLDAFVAAFGGANLQQRNGKVASDHLRAASRLTETNNRRRVLTVPAPDVRDERAAEIHSVNKILHPAPGAVARAVPLLRDGVVHALDVLQLDARNDFRRNSFARALRGCRVFRVAASVRRDRRGALEELGRARRARPHLAAPLDARDAVRRSRERFRRFRRGSKSLAFPFSSCVFVLESVVRERAAGAGTSRVRLAPLALRDSLRGLLRLLLRAGFRDGRRGGGVGGATHSAGVRRSGSVGVFFFALRGDGAFARAASRLRRRDFLGQRPDSADRALRAHEAESSSHINFANFTPLSTVLRPDCVGARDSFLRRRRFFVAERAKRQRHARFKDGRNRVLVLVRGGAA